MRKAFTSSGGRRLYAGALLAALVALFAGLLGEVAGAHAAYKFSSPDDESTVAQAPVEIWAEYTEPPTDASYLEVFDPCGAQVDNGDSRADATQNRVYVTQSGDRSGVYRVEWFVDSAADAHPTRGTFTFTVTGGEPCPGAEEPKAEREPRQKQSDASRKDADGSQEQAPNDDPADDGNSASSGQTTDRDSRHQHDRRKPERARKQARSDRDRDRSLVALDDPAPPEEPGLLSDIPIGGLVIALAMTTAIGAAGGFIYAGIMGYHKISE